MSDSCKGVPGSILVPAPPKVKVHAAIDGHPICMTSSKFVDDQSHGSESTQEKHIKNNQFWLSSGGGRKSFSKKMEMPFNPKSKYTLYTSILVQYW